MPGQRKRKHDKGNRKHGKVIQKIGKKRKKNDWQIGHNVKLDKTKLKKSRSIRFVCVNNHIKNSNWNISKNVSN